MGWFFFSELKFLFPDDSNLYQLDKELSRTPVKIVPLFFFPENLTKSHSSGGSASPVRFKNTCEKSQAIQNVRSQQATKAKNVTPEKQHGPFQRKYGDPGSVAPPNSTECLPHMLATAAA